MEPLDPVYPTMRWVYPAVFVAMAVEGICPGRAARSLVVAGSRVFVVAKLLKVWAIPSLGDRWTYKVLVLPGAPLVASGPYRFVRHPNYVGVIGELVGMALIIGRSRHRPARRSSSSLAARAAHSGGRPGAAVGIYWRQYESGSGESTFTS